MNEDLEKSTQANAEFEEQPIIWLPSPYLANAAWLDNLTFGPARQRNTFDTILL